METTVKMSRSYWRAHGFQSLLSKPIKLFSYTGIYIEDISETFLNEASFMSIHKKNCCLLLNHCGYV